MKKLKHAFASVVQARPSLLRSRLTRLPPSQLHFFLIVFGFDAQVGCGVVGFSSEVCASGASNDSIAPIHRWRVQLMSRCRRICCVQIRGFRPHALETRSQRCEVMWACANDFGGDVTAAADYDDDDDNDDNYNNKHDDNGNLVCNSLMELVQSKMKRRPSMLYSLEDPLPASSSVNVWAQAVKEKPCDASLALP